MMIFRYHKTRAKPVLVCFAGCDWWYHNRGLFCPQVMTRLTKNYKVLFINSLGMRIPTLKRDKYAFKKILRKLKSIARYLRRSDNGMYIFTPISLPFFKSSILGPIITFLVLLQIKMVMILLSLREPIFYVGCPPAWEIVKRLHHRYLIYECTDIFEEMPGTNKHYIASLDKEISESANLVLYVNKALWKKGVSRNKNSLLVGHGVDFNLFVNATESKYVPEDMVKIPKPIIGFFGDISEEVCDFLLLEHIAKMLPNMSMVFVGPISADVSRLKQFENVHFLGQKPYEEIPHYGKVFDVAIMPWNRSKWIKFCNPVKIKEYLALGKPVVSTYYPEIELFNDLVYVAGNYIEFVSHIRKATKDDNIRLKRECRKRVQNETWDNKVEQILRYIKKDRQQTNDI